MLLQGILEKTMGGNPDRHMGLQVKLVAAFFPPMRGIYNQLLFSNLLTVINIGEDDVRLVSNYSQLNTNGASKLESVARFVCQCISPNI